MSEVRLTNCAYLFKKYPNAYSYLYHLKGFLFQVHLPTQFKCPVFVYFVFLGFPKQPELFA